MTFDITDDDMLFVGITFAGIVFGKSGTTEEQFKYIGEVVFEQQLYWKLTVECFLFIHS